MDDGTVTPTGIDPIGDLPWGTHICLFYETPNDLIESEAAFFAAGLAAGEFCIWALADPVGHEDAIEGLGRLIPDFHRRLEARQMEIIPDYESYMRAEGFAPKRITRDWQVKSAEAQAKGFSGLRGSGMAFWQQAHLWKDFRAYEEELDRSLEGRKIIALCTYSLDEASAGDMLDVAPAHHFSIARRKGRWEFFETPELAVARRELSRLRNAFDVLSGEAPGGARLTPRERVVLAQIAKGASAKESARALGISPRTVEFHRANIMQKLGARNVADLLNKVFSE